MTADRVTITPDQAGLLTGYGWHAADVYLACDPFDHVTGPRADEWDGDVSRNRPPSGVVGARGRRARLDWLTIAALADQARRETPDAVAHLDDMRHAFRNAYGRALTSDRTDPAARRAADVECGAASARLLDALREVIRPAVRAPRGATPAPAGSGAGRHVLWPIGVRPVDLDAATADALAIVAAERTAAPVQNRPAPPHPLTCTECGAHDAHAEHDDTTCRAEVVEHRSNCPTGAELVAADVARTIRGDLAAEIRRALAAGQLDRLPALVDEARHEIRHEAARVERVHAMRERKAAEQLAAAEAAAPTLVPLADVVTMLVQEPAAPARPAAPAPLVLPGLDHLAPMTRPGRGRARYAQPADQLALI